MREFNNEVFEDVIGFGDTGVSDGVTSNHKPETAKPVLNPAGGEAVDKDAFLSLAVECQPADPEVNPADNYSRNYGLERLRNQHPFVQVDPPLINSRLYVLQFGESAIVPIPPQASMVRFTWQQNAVGSILAISRRRGIQAASGTSNLAGEDGVIVNPSPTWRVCGHGGEYEIKNIGTANRIVVSLEFFMQL